MPPLVFCIGFRHRYHYTIGGFRHLLHYCLFHSPQLSWGFEFVNQEVQSGQHRRARRERHSEYLRRLEKAGLKATGAVGKLIETEYLTKKNYRVSTYLSDLAVLDNRKINLKKYVSKFKYVFQIHSAHCLICK